MAAAMSEPVMERLAAALGIADRRIVRLVFVCELEQPVMIYVQEQVEESQANAVAEVMAEKHQGAGFTESAELADIVVEAVQDVVVDPNGNVFIEPKQPSVKE